MPKLSEYVEQAATEYLQETGNFEADARWIAEFFQDCGVLDEYPRQNLISFFALVQKALHVRSERAAKEAQRHLDQAGHSRKLRP